MKTFIDLMIYSFSGLLLLNIVFNTQGKPESDRHEALEIAKYYLSRARSIYIRETSQHNPITTGLFSAIISLPFKNLRYLYGAFWVFVLTVMYLNDVSVWWLVVLMPFMIRTALYRLEEVYFIMIPIYFALQGYWYLWATLLIWRNPFTSIEVVKKPLNKRALVLDYCLFVILFLLAY